MKRFFTLLCLFFIPLCYSQKKVVATDRDIFCFQFLDEGVALKNEIYNNKAIVALYPWAFEDMGVGYFEKRYEFKYHNKIMYLKTKRKLQYYNFYFKNIPFKEGYYLVEISELKWKETIKGSEISVPEELQNILFLDADAARTTTAQNIYFKDLEFIVIDLKDTKNVKIEPISKKKYLEDNVGTGLKKDF